MKINDIKINPQNPRIIKDDKFKKLCDSIKSFPKMLSLRPIVVDDNMMILGGNMRFKALKELGFKDLQDDWVKIANELTDEEKRRFIIEDNIGFGDWDYDMLANDYDVDELKEYGMDDSDLKMYDDENNDSDDNDDKLKTMFQVTIDCENESEQKETFDKLTAQGFKCNILSL